jgi:hypothetical protein
MAPRHIYIYNNIPLLLFCSNFLFTAGTNIDTNFDDLFNIKTRVKLFFTLRYLVCNFWFIFSFF